jgi:hypothetical protein
MRRLSMQPYTSWDGIPWLVVATLLGAALLLSAVAYSAPLNTPPGTEMTPHSAGSLGRPDTCGNQPQRIPQPQGWKMNPSSDRSLFDSDTGFRVSLPEIDDPLDGRAYRLQPSNPLQIPDQNRPQEEQPRCDSPATAIAFAQK